MSTFGGTNTVNTPTDPSLQEAPRGESGPEFGTLKKAFEDCINSCQPYIDQCRINYETRYAIWQNQSADGRKHARGMNQPDPTPWDGASDLRVYLVDEAINSKVALLGTAFKRANIIASPIEGNDYRRSKTVQDFMRWLVRTQIPELGREVELLAQYIQEKGVAVTGQFWETLQEKTLTTVTIENVQELVPNIDVIAALGVEELTDDFVALFEERYGCAKKKAKRMLSELRSEGTTTVATLGKVIRRPVVRAFNLDSDLFIPDSSTDIENASGIYRVQYFGAEQLRSFVNTDGWDKDWVEAAIKKCKGQMISMAYTEYNQPQNRSFMYINQRMTDKIGVCYAYQRLSDEDGVPGIYLTIFNPMLPDGPENPGYAKYQLLGYAHGKYPFVLHRREYLSRKLHDSRGIPEPGQPIQDQIKVHKDSRIDAASVAILPPMGYPAGRPPGKWGAGARVPERRPGEYHYLDRPLPDMNTEKSEQLLHDDFMRYNGFVSNDTDPQFAQLKNQYEIEKFLGSWSAAFNQIWKLWCQFGPKQVYFRVIGVKTPQPIDFNVQGPDEDYDFTLQFNVDSMNAELSFQKLEQIAKIVATADRNGIIDYDEWLQVMVEAVDPAIAERIIRPAEEGQQKVVGEMQELLSKIYAGFEQDIKPGTPPELGMSVLQNYIQSDPVVQQKMQNKQDPFGQRIEKIAKQLKFSYQQNVENPRIGRMGTL